MEFLPKKRRMLKTLKDYPNTITLASIVRELKTRVEKGQEPIYALIEIVEEIKEWKSEDRPTATGVVEVQFNGRGHGYAFNTDTPVGIGDVVEVYTSVMGRTEAIVSSLSSDYSGYTSPIIRIIKKGF